MSSLISDPQYLQVTQYASSVNLTARADLHVRFSRNSQGWNRWLFDQLDLQPGDQVLEVGGGPGWLWRENRERLPAGVHVCGTDFSPGMTQEARQALTSTEFWRGAVLAAQALPFPSAAFRVVTANHMLYHVPAIEQALRELARVLQPGGRLVAATNGRPHMQELHALLQVFEPQYDRPEGMSATARFGLENGPALVQAVLGHPEVRLYPDGLWVTDAALLADYALSLWSVANAIAPERREALIQFFQQRIAVDGGIAITKVTGVIVAAA